MGLRLLQLSSKGMGWDLGLKFCVFCFQAWTTFFFVLNLLNMGKAIIVEEEDCSRFSLQDEDNEICLGRFSSASVISENSVRFQTFSAADLQGLLTGLIYERTC